MKIDLTICPTVRPLVDLLCAGVYPIATDIAISADPTVTLAAAETMSKDSLLGHSGGFEYLFTLSLYRFLANYQIGDKKIEVVTNVDDTSITVVAEAGSNPMFEMSFGYNGIVRIFGPSYTVVLDSNKQLIPVFLSWTDENGEVVSSVRYTNTEKGRVGHYIHNKLDVDQILKLEDSCWGEDYEKSKVSGKGITTSLGYWHTDGIMKLWNDWAETIITRKEQEDGSVLISSESHVTKEGHEKELWSHAKTDKGVLTAYGWASSLIKEGETFYLELNKVEEA